MKSMNRMKKAVLALAGAAVMVTGVMSQSAQAFNFQQNDLVLAIYGNEKEVLVNLSDLTPVAQPGPVGNMGQILASSTVYTYDLAPYLNALGVLPGSNPGGLTNPLRYTVMGFVQDEETFETVYKAGSAATASEVGVQTSSILFVSKMDVWGGNVTDANTPNVNPTTNVALVDRLTTQSFTGRMGIGDQLAGGFNQAMAANLDQLLNIVQGDPFASSNPVTAMGQALLSLNGQFQITGGQIAAIPVPAAVVLFGSGLIGLAGLARRNMFGRAARA